MKTPLVLSALLLVSACTPASLILMSARNEHRILHRDATRPHVEKYLGAPLEEKVISPTPIEDFRFPDVKDGPSTRFQNHRYYYSPGYSPSAEDRQVVASYYRYQARGKIVPHGYAGDAIAMSLMTGGVGEILALPMAIGEVMPDSTIVNDFEVWFSTKGRVLAYVWKWRSEDESANEPNSERSDSP